MTIKHPKGMDFSWTDDRIPFEIFLDRYYYANQIEREAYNETSISKSEYYERNQDFLISKFKKENEYEA